MSSSTPLVAQTAKRLPAIQETQVQPLGREDLLEKEMATHSSILTWKIPRTKKPGRLQSIASQRVRHEWVTSLSVSFFLLYPLQPILLKITTLWGHQPFCLNSVNLPLAYLWVEPRQYCCPLPTFFPYICGTRCCLWKWQWADSVLNWPQGKRSELYGQKGGIRATGELRMNYFNFFYISNKYSGNKQIHTYLNK